MSRLLFAAVIGSVRLGKVLDVPAFIASRLLLPDDDSEVKNYFNTGIF
jgi:hypothetical protein